MLSMNRLNIGVEHDDVKHDIKQWDVNIDVPFKVWIVTRGNGHNAIEYASYLYGKGIIDESTGKLVNRAGKRAKRIKYTTHSCAFQCTQVCTTYYNAC